MGRDIVGQLEAVVPDKLLCVEGGVITHWTLAVIAGRPKGVKSITSVFTGDKSHGKNIG